MKFLLSIPVGEEISISIFHEASNIIIIFGWQQDGNMLPFPFNTNDLLFIIKSWTACCKLYICTEDISHVVGMSYVCRLQAGAGMRDSCPAGTRTAHTKKKKDRNKGGIKEIRRGGRSPNPFPMTCVHQSTARRSSQTRKNQDRYQDLIQSSISLLLVAYDALHPPNALILSLLSLLSLSKSIAF